MVTYEETKQPPRQQIEATPVTKNTPPDNNNPEIIDTETA